MRLDAFDQPCKDEVEGSIGDVTAHKEEAKCCDEIPLARARETFDNGEDETLCPSIRVIWPPSSESKLAWPGEQPQTLFRGSLWFMRGFRMFPVA